MDLAAYDVLSTAVLMLGEQGAVAHANAAAEELFGVSRKVLQGVLAQDLFEPDEVLKNRLPGALRGEYGTLHYALIARRRTGDVPVNMTLLPLAGAPWAAVLELRTPEREQLLDRHHAMTRERESQRSLLRNLAHEIKNPLGGIRGAAQLLDGELASLERTGGDPSLRDYTRVIVAETGRLSALIDRLIAPQGEALQLSTFNIHEVCERVYTLVRSEFADRFEIVRDYDSSVPDVSGDFQRLVQTLLNMARNAGQALTEGRRSEAGREYGEPRLTLRTRIGHCLYLPHSHGGLAVILSVIDNGPGVPESLKETIFHPLATGRPQGTGLGLNLAQEYAQQHGGLIEFESRPGHTEFRLILPMEMS